jgi:hypothetical protein
VLGCVLQKTEKFKRALNKKFFTSKEWVVVADTEDDDKLDGELEEHEGLKEKCKAVLIKNIFEMDDKKIEEEAAPIIVASAAASTAEEDWKPGNTVAASDCTDDIYSRCKKKHMKKGNPIEMTNEGPQNMQAERKKFKSEVKNE